jgi:hypothetical protein
MTASRSRPTGRGRPRSSEFYGAALDASQSYAAADRDGNWVSIEVKKRYAKLSHVDQLWRYVKRYTTARRTTHRCEEF